MKKAFKIKTAYGWVHLYYDEEEKWYAVKETTGEISKPYDNRVSIIKKLLDKTLDWS